MDFQSYLQSEKVSSVGYRPTVSVGPDATIEQTIELMQARRVGCVLVVGEGGGLLGIFTERDVLRKVLADGATAQRGDSVESVMTPEPATVRADEPLAVLFRRMFDGGFRHIPLFSDAGDLLGTISIARVVSFIADQFPQAVYNLPPEPERFGSAREGA